jgi:hypothetical protein
MTERVLLVGCVAKKAPYAAPACELYTSDLFKKRRAYAEMQGIPWAIVSAKYGIVLPDTPIEPYDMAMREYRDRPEAELEAWRRRAKTTLQKVWPRLRAVELHAGQDYFNALLPVARDLGLTVIRPLQGKGIGEQLGWYKKNLSPRQYKLPF